MKRIAVFMVFTIFLEISATDLYKQIFAVEQFISPEEECHVNWFLNQNQSCEWCDTVFEYFIQDMKKAYHSSSVYTETIGVSEYHVKSNLKGTSFINFFISTNLKILTTILNPNLFKDIHGDDWYFFADVSSYRWARYMHLLDTYLKIYFKS